MKKLMLLSLAGAVSFGAFAQNSLNKTVATKTITKPAVTIQAAPRATQAAGTATPAKGAEIKSRWYNHAESMAKASSLSMEDLMNNEHAAVAAMWQDTSVYYPGSTDGIGYLSYAQLFDPFADVYNDEFLYPVTSPDILRMNKTTPYKLDSVRIKGYYTRTNTSYVDTLILTFITESASKKFSYLSYTGSPDSFALIAWAGEDYLVEPITQVSYGSSGNFLPTPVVVKVPLNDATFADSTMDGFHEIYAAPNMNIIAGAKVSVSVTFKSGTAYTPGTEITDYNFFSFLSHEIVTGGTPTVIGNDNSMSYVALGDSTNSQLNTSLNYYIPATGFTAPFRLEDHNISWKISANVTTSVASVNGNITADAYPNPASTQLYVPVTVKADANVSVSITNAIGQTVATQNLGHVAAGQKATAKFNTSALANGVYFYTVEANGQRLTQRFAVSR